MASNRQNGSIITDTASGVYSRAQRSLDRVVPASSRQEAYDSVASFASARPILFAFAVSQAAFSFLPLLTFIVFALSTVALALAAALIFALFWIGLAFMLLVPALLVTSSVAVLVWAWAVGSFLVARWLYAHSPVAVQGELRIEETGKGRGVDVVKGDRGFEGSVKKGDA